jgi:hypothetical protein
MIEGNSSQPKNNFQPNLGVKKARGRALGNMMLYLIIKLSISCLSWVGRVADETRRVIILNRTNSQGVRSQARLYLVEVL